MDFPCFEFEKVGAKFKGELYQQYRIMSGWTDVQIPGTKSNYSLLTFSVGLVLKDFNCIHLHNNLPI
jgi:hypothetical protein